MQFESSPYEESFTRRHSSLTFRAWTVVGFQVDAVPYPDGFYDLRPLGGRPVHRSHGVEFVRS